MVKNSVGNILEILDMLDADKYSGEEIRQNYLYLIDKWGEWEIIGAGSAGLVVRYVDIGRAMFSGLMMLYMVLAAVAATIAVIFGKIVYPLLAKYYEDSNEEMVDLATLQSASQINKMSKKEWF